MQHCDLKSDGSYIRHVRMCRAVYASVDMHFRILTLTFFL